MTKLHKSLLAGAAVFAISSPGYAQDSSPPTDRIVSDPLYLPLQGQIFGDTSYTFGATTQDVFDSTGAKQNGTRINLHTIGQGLMYGLTDDFTLRFDWGYVPARDVTRRLVPNGTVSLSSSGWTDPDFGVTYRVLDQQVSPLTVDLSADYSPDAFPAKSPSGIDEGTVARGGQAVDLGLVVGRELDQFTIAGTFDAQYLDGRDIQNQNTGDFTRTDSLWNYRLGLATQTRFDDRFSLNAGIGHTFQPNENVFNESNGLHHISEQGDSTDLNAALNYHFIPNQVVGSLEYQHTFYDDTRNLFPAVPANDTSIRDKNEDAVGVRLRYVFQ